MNPHVPRVGTFFILIGSGFLCLFLLTLFGSQFHFVYFLIAAVSLFLGIRMRGKPAARPSAGRFGVIRKAGEQMRKSKEAREKQRKEREERKKKR